MHLRIYVVGITVVSICIRAALGNPPLERPLCFTGLLPGFQYNAACAAVKEEIVCLWGNYRNGQERVYWTRIQAGRVDPPRLASAGTGVYYAPRIAAEPGRGLAVWMSWREGTWGVESREFVPIVGSTGPVVDRLQRLWPVVVSGGHQITVA